MAAGVEAPVLLLLLQQQEGLSSAHEQVAALTLPALRRNETTRRKAIAEHITGPSIMSEALDMTKKLGGQGVHVLPAKQMYPFHWLMTDPKWGGEGERL